MSHWYYLKGGRPIGPLTEDQLKTLQTSGEIASDALLWNPSLPRWAPASSLPGALVPPLPELAKPRKSMSTGMKIALGAVFGIPLLGLLFLILLLVIGISAEESKTLSSPTQSVPQSPIPQIPKNLVPQQPTPQTPKKPTGPYTETPSFYTDKPRLYDVSNFAFLLTDTDFRDRAESMELHFLDSPGESFTLGGQGLKLYFECKNLPSPRCLGYEVSLTASAM